jgi:hypothetical protein
VALDKHTVVLRQHAYRQREQRVTRVVSAACEVWAGAGPGRRDRARPTAALQVVGAHMLTKLTTGQLASYCSPVPDSLPTGPANEFGTRTGVTTSRSQPARCIANLDEPGTAGRLTAQVHSADPRPIRLNTTSCSTASDVHRLARLGIGRAGPCQQLWLRTSNKRATNDQEPVS